MDKLTIAPSPHVHTTDSVRRNMYGVAIALAPALIVTLLLFGLDALAVILTSVVACVAVEFLVQKFILKVPTTITDGSAIVTGLILAFNLPPSLPLWIVVIGAIFSIGVCKMTFGGLGQNIVNPAIGGRVFLLMSFPAQMTNWAVDGQTGATPLGLVKEAIKSGKSISEVANIPSSADLFLGNVGGSMGEVSAIALIIGFAFLLIARIITWHIPVAVVGSMFVFQGLLFVANPDAFVDPLFAILTGGALLGAIFMATDYVTSPMTHKGMIIYGCGIGLLTVVIRNFGAYPEGMSFAILIMNLVTPLINRYCKPKRFGEIAK
ncbi:MAG: RnfABCDGE type electron transport complex subunit D [Marinilabiliaceae bacterium]